MIAAVEEKKERLTQKSERESERETERGYVFSL